ncbi:hypothetical protein CALCODRAFT_512584 [Calocera cornea HHB12733]|uniref:Mif2/CENP-C cupin domain-containing protein n=1 Tax=Calocera cornea HHB12733 TaxID=1353952 RepID=A0A165CXI9_9BASI|nr:hypothetical protein CALCODRAFT_512584 [Calocera cornea HHB12733]
MDSDDDDRDHAPHTPSPMRKGSLATWLNSMSPFGKGSSNGHALPVIQRIVQIRLGRDEAPSTSRKRRTEALTSHRATSRARLQEASGPQRPHDSSMQENVEEVDREGTVIDPNTGDEVVRKLWGTVQHSDPLSSAHGVTWTKAFSVHSSAAGAFVRICGHSRKPWVTSNSMDNVYCIIHGCLDVEIRQNKFSLAAGGAFLVPKGNPYSMTNNGNEEVLLFVTQIQNTEGSSTSLTDVVGSTASVSSGAASEWCNPAFREEQGRPHAHYIPHTLTANVNLTSRIVLDYTFWLDPQPLPRVADFLVLASHPTRWTAFPHVNKWQI